MSGPDDNLPAEMGRAPGARPAIGRGDVIDGTVSPEPGDGMANGDLTHAAEGDVIPRRASITPRRDSRVSPPRRHAQWLVNQLPVGMLGSDFFVRFVSIFQEMGETLMSQADQVKYLPDATVAPTPLLPYLASWIDARTVDASLPEELQRLILRSAAKALALRGTKRGLSEYLEMLSGGPVDVIDGGGVWAPGDSPEDPAWVRLQVASTGHLSESEFVALVRDEIPADVRAELWVGGRRVLSTAEEERA